MIASSCSRLQTFGFALRVLGIFISCLAAPAFAAQSGNFTYIDLGWYTIITDYPKTATGVVSIPAAINGKPVKRIGPSAFQYCTQISGVTFPAGLEVIEREAFQGCQNLTGPIVLPAGMIGVNENAFAYCSGITSLSIPASMTGLSASSFSPCDRLASITVDPANRYFQSSGGVLFQKLDWILMLYPPGKAGAYTIPSNITRVGSRAFFGCDDLTSVKIPTSVTRLEDEAFYGCSGLTSVTLPKTLTSIGARCFSYSANLRSIVIPPSVTSIGVRAFANCYALESATIPASVKALGAGAYASCSVLTTISVDPENSKFTSVDGVVFNKAKTALIQYPTGRAGTYDVPVGVSKILDSAFSGSWDLTRVSLPVGVESIASGAFFLCPGLVEIPLPVGLLTIGDSAFWSCRSLTNVRIPASVTGIGTYAWYGCSMLRSAEFRGDAPTMGSGVFSGAANGFKVSYFNGKAGFTTPAWLGNPTVDRGSFVPLPPEIVVADSAGNALEHGYSTVKCGKVETGESSSLAFTILNAGETSLKGIEATVVGANSADFRLSAIASTTLPEGRSTTFQLTFSPAKGGERAATVRIESSDDDGGPFEFAVTGTATGPVAPEISVYQEKVKLADGKMKISFGTVMVKKTGSSKTFTIKNAGTGKLSGLVIKTDGSHTKDFVVTQPSKSSLAPGASTSFKVSFKPAGKGTRSAAIHIKSNDADENPFDIKLTGMGAAK